MSADPDIVTCQDDTGNLHVKIRLQTFIIFLMTFIASGVKHIRYLRRMLGYTAEKVL